MSQPVRLFIFASPEDNGHLSKLVVHLEPIRDQKNIEIWNHQSITPGSNYESEIEHQIHSANIILILITADFLSSSDVKFVPVALELRRQGLAVVIPILVRPVAWEFTPFGELEPLPRNHIAVTVASNQDEAWTEIVREIHALLVSPQILSRPVSDGPAATVAGRQAVSDQHTPLLRGQFSQRVYLRVLNTPYIYEAVPGAESISVGRQRRKPGADPASGNDVVLRIPDGSAKSLAISRRHLEIRRDGQEFFVVDYSKHGTRLNGTPLQTGSPTPLHARDRLLIADALNLEFLVEQVALLSKPLARPEIGLNMIPGTPLIMEASTGDMRTEDP